MRAPLLVGAALAMTACGATPAGWQQRDVGPNTLRFQPVDAATAESLAPAISSGIADVEAFFGGPFAARFTVHVLPDRAAMTAWWHEPSLQTECWRVAAGTEDTLTLLSPRVWATEACEHDAADAEHVRRLVAHELVHVYHDQHNPRPELEGLAGIGWFVEGLAVLASGQLDAGQRRRAEQAVARGAAPAELERAWSGPYRYGVSGSLVERVDGRLGRAGLVALLPATDEATLLAAIGLGEAELLAEWRRETARSGRAGELAFVDRTLREVYSHLESKQRRQGFVYPAWLAENRARLEGVTDEAGYRALLDAFLARFHDGHLRVRRRSESEPGELPAPVTHRWLAPGVLLTRIARLWGDEAEIRAGLDRGLAMLPEARALVIDLRGNGGGNDALAFEYLGRLTTRDIPLGRFSVRWSDALLARRPHLDRLYAPDPQRPGWSRWRTFEVEAAAERSFAGPIAVLIDRACYSSCEGAALALKNSGLATLYGQATGGGSANPIFVELPWTDGELMVPTWVQIMPDGDPLEDHGVPPDVALPEGDDALRRALDDLGVGRDAAR